MVSKKNLRTAFALATLSVAGCSTAGLGVPKGAQHPLTPQEIELGQAIFGDSIDYKKVRILLDEKPKYNTKLEKDASAEVSDERFITFYSPLYHSSNYAKSAIVTPYKLYVHELTHIWQNQTGNGGKSCAVYDYTLTAQSKFSDFCNEQQASIIADYAGYFLFPSHASSPDNMLNDKTWPFDPALGPLLAKVVEDAFPEAKKTRLSGKKAPAYVSGQYEATWPVRKTFTRKK